MSHPSHRSHILSLYKQIHRIAKTWQGPIEEKQYIKQEARDVFHMNAHLTNPQEIQEKILEAESRIDLALHYKIPQPRPFHLPSDSFVEFPPCHVPIYDSSRAVKFKGTDSYEPEKTDF